MELVNICLFQVWGSLPSGHVWNGALAQQKPEHCECVMRDLKLMQEKGIADSCQGSRNQQEAGGPGWGVSRKRQDA